MWFAVATTLLATRSRVSYVGQASGDSRLGVPLPTTHAFVLIFEAEAV